MVRLSNEKSIEDIDHKKHHYNEQGKNWRPEGGILNVVVVVVVESPVPLMERTKQERWSKQYCNGINRLRGGWREGRSK
jgi:hypothetical protein